MAAAQPQPTMMWLVFAILTVASWGVYGICLHSGQVAMGDPVNGRWKAFLFVGIAYFLVAVLAPLTILLLKGASWHRQRFDLFHTGTIAWPAPTPINDRSSERLRRHRAGLGVLPAS